MKGRIMGKTTITDLLEAGVHFGHQTRRWNPKMKRYIYGTRSGITIFDLGKSMQLLSAACDFLRETASQGKQILFVGAKRQAQECVRGTADRLNMPFMCDRWLGGTLTNQKVMITRVAYMKKLIKQEANGEFDKLPKKEVAGLRRELHKLQTALGGISNLKGLPAAVIVIDIDREHIAVKEAAKLGIPIVALVDSNCNPDSIDYVVPGNDDALRSIKVIVEAFSTAVEEGLGVAARKSQAKDEPITEAAIGKTDEKEATDEK